MKARFAAALALAGRVDAGPAFLVAAPKIDLTLVDVATCGAVAVDILVAMWTGATGGPALDTLTGGKHVATTVGDLAGVCPYAHACVSGVCFCMVIGRSVVARVRVRVYSDVGRLSI